MRLKSRTAPSPTASMCWIPTASFNTKPNSDLEVGTSPNHAPLSTGCCGQPVTRSKNRIDHNLRLLVTAPNLYFRLGRLPPEFSPRFGRAFLSRRRNARREEFSMPSPYRERPRHPADGVVRGGDGFAI